MGRPRLVVNGDPHSSFIVEDIRILSRDFEVVPFHYTGKRNLLSLARAIRGSDLCVSWFVDTHARVAQGLCRWIGRPHVAIIGGYEVASDPQVGYGLLATRGPGAFLRQRFLRHVLRHASAVVVPSRFSREEVLRLQRPRRLEVVPLGVDTERFKPLEKTAGVGTVAEVVDPSRDVKGLTTLLRAAGELPDLDFHIIGAVKDEGVAQAAPPNVKCHGPLAHDQVAELLGGLKVYCQLSRRESFGLATAEAMAAGCVPVVSDRGALPEVVGDIGFRVAYGDVEGVVKAIRSALGMPVPNLEARHWVAESFGLDRRRKGLENLLSSLVTSPNPGAS